MVDGIDYDDLFVPVGWYPKIYDLKMVVLVLFIFTMPIVVNNALIGLAVGDTNEVMKSARFDKFLRRVRNLSHFLNFPNFAERFCGISIAIFHFVTG